MSIASTLRAFRSNVRHARRARSLLDALGAISASLAGIDRSLALLAEAQLGMPLHEAERAMQAANSAADTAFVAYPDRKAAQQRADAIRLASALSPTLGAQLAHEEQLRTDENSTRGAFQNVDEAVQAAFEELEEAEQAVRNDASAEPIHYHPA